MRSVVTISKIASPIARRFERVTASITGAIFLGALVIAVNAARMPPVNSSSLAFFQRARSALASSRSPDSAGPASTTITGPTSSGWYDAIQYAMKPPMLWPTMIGSRRWRERM